MSYKKFKKGVSGFPNGRPKNKTKIYRNGTGGFNLNDAAKINAGIGAMSKDESGNTQKVTDLVGSGLSIASSIFRKGVKGKKVSTQMKYRCGTKGMKKM